MLFMFITLKAIQKNRLLGAGTQVYKLLSDDSDGSITQRCLRVESNRRETSP